MNFGVWLACIAFLLSGAIGIFSLLRPPHSLVRRLFALGMVVFAIEALFGGLSLQVPDARTLVLWQRLRLLASSLVPGTWFLFSLVYSRGNYAEFLSRRKTAVRAAFILPIAAAVLFWRSLIVGIYDLGDGSYWQPVLGWSGFVLHVFLILGAVLALMNLEKTLRSSIGTMRWQIKFMMIGLTVIFAPRIYISTQVLIYSAVNISLESLNALALCAGSLLMLRSLRRARLETVDVYPSLRFLYNSLSLLVVGIYLLVVGLLAKLVTYFGHDEGLPLQAFVVFIALLVLTVVLLSEKVRQRTRRFVSRHFHRPQYDHQKIWSDFTAQTAHLTSSSEFCRAVNTMISQTFQALSVTMWLIDDTRGQFIFGGSTAVTESESDDLVPEGEDASTLIDAIRAEERPVDIDQSNEPWVEKLKEFNPDCFRKGGNRICAPLTAGNELLGLMVLGDRVSGLAYTDEELDLITTIADQVAAGLLSIKLSERLLQAREMEAFQTMSTFFVHDLKNTASTLSLMLQNLPKHFDEPAFREDALRGIAKCVDKINGLISRLAVFRGGMEIKGVETDVNELVSEVIDGFQGTDNIQMDLDRGKVPPTKLDPEQMRKVFTNLLANAREAIEDDSGQITVSTEQRGNWAVISVSDNGKGMAREFIDQRLFGAFRTTKKEGLGIGLFQSKMIIDAHHGKFEVTSEEGVGSTFSVWLPLSGD